MAPTVAAGTEEEKSATLHIVSAHARLRDLIDDGSIVALDVRRRDNTIKVKFVGYLTIELKPAS